MKENNAGSDSQNSNAQTINTVNIMVAGKTGTGKSTLLNAIFGEELAATGVGRPVTEHINEYENKNIPIHIWDTVGLELDSQKTKQTIDEIKRIIASKAELEKEFDPIHAIWYCINSGSNRYEGAELNFIKELYALRVPFTIVLTQCYGAKKAIEEFEAEINKMNREMELNNISIVKVLAQDYEVEIDDDKIITKRAFGIEDLVDITMERLPEYVQSGFAAAQKVSESLKHSECEKLIWNYVACVRNNDGSKSKIVNWDNIPFINILTANSHIKNLFHKVSNIYHMVLSEQEVDNVVKELGGLSPEYAWKGLVSPVHEKFDEDVKELYDLNNNGNHNDDFSDLPTNMRVARLLVFYGYTFLVSIEKYWEVSHDEKGQLLPVDVDELVKIIRDIFKKMDKKDTKKAERKSSSLKQLSQ